MVLFQCLVLLLFPLSLLASNLSINPVKINMSRQDSMAVLRIKNLGENTTLLQVNIKKWTQKNGKDIYLSTDEIIAAPLIFEIKPGKTQLIRMMQRQRKLLENEQSFRVFVREILKDESVTTRHRKEELKVKLEFVIPFFIAPERHDASTYYWTVDKINAKSINVTLNNTSNHHLFINQLLVQDKQGHQLSAPQNVFFYLLADMSHHLTISLKDPAQDKDVVIITNLDIDKPADVNFKK